MKRHCVWIAAGLLVFAVVACNPGKNSTNQSTNSGNAQESPSSASTSTGVIKEIHLAKDDGNGAPGEETNAFSPGDRTIHCVVKLADAKSGSKIRFSWWVIDAEGAKNEKINDTDYATRPNEDSVHGLLKLPEDWPSGKYKVEVYVNNNLEETARFSVK